MDPKTIGMLFFTVAFLIVVIVILGISHYSLNISTANNGILESLNYIPISYNEDGTILQDPSCQLLERVHVDYIDAATKGLYKVRDYYILSSYNSCNTGTELQNNTISLTALKYVISQGVRLLDFEIYSLNNEPIVSTSNNPDNYYMFQSSNYVNFSDAFETIINNAFNKSTCPTCDDPLFVHLRVKSNNTTMLNKLANIFKINDIPDGHILGSKYSFAEISCNQNLQKCKNITADDPSYNYCHPDKSINDASYNITFGCNTTNIMEEPLYYFKQKIIIILDKSNTTALDCQDLMEFVNITSNSLYCRLINNFTMVNSQDQVELLEFNKRTVTIVTPDVGINKPNPDINKSRLLGIQFNANNFFQKDNYLNNSINMFNSARKAFILKPEIMRYYPIFVTLPPENPAGYSFKSRPIKTKFLSLSI